MTRTVHRLAKFIDQRIDRFLLADWVVVWRLR